MNRREVIAGLGSLVLLPTAPAAQPAGPARIGLLTPQRPASLEHNIGALRNGLADYGYVEGRNLVIEYRYGNDAIERVPDLAAELVRLPVSLIVAQGAAVAVVQKLGLPVPIVYVTSGDPVSSGFAESLSRPLSNMTGMTFMSAEMNVKRLELLRDLLPQLRRVGVIANPEHPGEQLERRYLEDTARDAGLVLRYFSTSTPTELTSAFDAMASDMPQAICVLADGFALQNRQRIIEFATSQRAPVISGWRSFAQSGAICTFRPRLEASYRRLAFYIDRVLKGAKPADLPIERPTTFELIFNLRTAKTLGLTIPPTLLARADEVIE